MAKTLNITLVKSSITCPKNQKLTLKALGLTKINKTVCKPDNEQIRGIKILPSSNSSESVQKTVIAVISDDPLDCFV